MKKITLNDKEILLPDAANFLAVDSSGDVWAYDNKPQKCVQSWALSVELKGHMYFVGHYPANEWETSLQNI
ncbi:hypothetical protein ACUH6D_001705 [Yersinia enterocolitica]|nr:hypothetical protein [Yersinia enterocolitica]